MSFFIIAGSSSVYGDGIIAGSYSNVLNQQITSICNGVHITNKSTLYTYAYMFEDFKWTSCDADSYQNIIFINYDGIKGIFTATAPDGTVLGHNTNIHPYNNELPLYLFASNFRNINIFPSVYASSYISYAKIEDKIFIPFVRDGVAGMIDINTKTFYQNANTEGEFSIVIEDYDFSRNQDT